MSFYAVGPIPSRLSGRLSLVYDATVDDKQKRILPVLLLALYLVEFCALAIRPYDRNVWTAENIPIVLIAAFLVITYRWFQFSNLAYLLMSALIFLHTIGGHYSFERVPFGWVTNLIGAQRNHFDRVAHFTVGFYAFGIAELIEQKQLSRSRWLTGLFAIFAICTVALGYEIFEWRYAVTADPAAGIAVLGSQGDPWDAQKDMLADSLGAIVATALYFARRRKVT
jgi:putative membrane protein